MSLLSSRLVRRQQTLQRKSNAGQPRSLSVESSHQSEDPTLSFTIAQKTKALLKDLRRRNRQLCDLLDREPSPEPSQPIQAAHRKVSLITTTATISKTPHSNRSFNDVDPKGRGYLTWMSIVSIAFLLNAFAIPLRSSYPVERESNLIYWLFADYFSDLIYLIDLVWFKPRLRLMKDGVPISEKKILMKRYLLSKGFKLDLIALTPLDHCYFWLFGRGEQGWTSFLRMPRLLKFQTFFALFDALDNSLSNPYIIRIAKTLFYMIYIIHCNSCVYYSLSAWQAFGQIAYRHGDKWHLNKWVYNNQGNAYIRCFYFTAAVATSTGNNPPPTNVIEYMYMTGSWMMGVFVFALLLGQIRDIVSNANRNRENFRETMDRALNECHKLQVPKQLSRRVQDWFIYTWLQQKTIDEKVILDKLPLKLQTDLALSVHIHTLEKVQLFQDCDRSLLRDLVLKLKPSIFLPGDFVCEKGDVGKEMYIVNQGLLQVVGGEKNQQVFAEMGQGAVFGEISLLAIGGNNKRTATIRSKGFSTLFALSKEDLSETLRDYPDAQQILRQKARQLLQKDHSSKEQKESSIDMKRTCRLSAAMSHPRLLEAVEKAKAASC